MQTSENNDMRIGRDYYENKMQINLRRLLKFILVSVATHFIFLRSEPFGWEYIQAMLQLNALLIFLLIIYGFFIKLINVVPGLIGATCFLLFFFNKCDDLLLHFGLPATMNSYEPVFFWLSILYFCYNLIFLVVNTNRWRLFVAAMQQDEGAPAPGE